MSLNTVQQALFLHYLWDEHKHRIKEERDYYARKNFRHDSGYAETRKWSVATKTEMVREQTKRQTLLDAMPSIADEKQ